MSKQGFFSASFACCSFKLKAIQKIYIFHSNVTFTSTKQDVPILGMQDSHEVRSVKGRRFP